MESKIKRSPNAVPLSDGDLERVCGGVGNTDELTPQLLRLIMQDESEKRGGGTYNG